MEPYRELEVEIAEWAGYTPEQVVVCSSGTAALHLALEAFQLPLGSEVLVPSFTMVACARAVALAGLTPVFVDCDDRLLMNYMRVEEALEKDAEQRIRAMMPVHIYGRKCDVDCFPQVSDCRIVEDLAEAHGVNPHPETDAACWSFFKNKIVAGEEGGAVAFREVRHAVLARQLRSLGFTNAHDFDHVPRGHNYRLANLLAEPILQELRLWNLPLVVSETPDGWMCRTVMDQRRLIEHWYQCECPTEWQMSPRDSPWVYDFRIPELSCEKQTEIVRALQASGIPARHAFKPMHLLEEFKHCRVIGGGEAERASREICYLPISPGITTEESTRLAFDIVRKVVSKD